LDDAIQCDIHSVLLFFFLFVSVFMGPVYVVFVFSFALFYRSSVASATNKEKKENGST
jgi:hypothetical protein